MRCPQLRQLPRSKKYETTGMLSYHSIWAEQVGQPERPPSERRSGTLATTTLRKLPTARAGPRNEGRFDHPAAATSSASATRSAPAPGTRHGRALGLRLGGLLRYLLGTPLLDRVLERHQEVVLVRRSARGHVPLDLAGQHELDQGLVEGLHVVVLAVRDRVR